MKVSILKISDNSLVIEFDLATDVVGGVLENSVMITTDSKNFVIRMTSDEYLVIDKQ